MSYLTMDAFIYLKNYFPEIKKKSSNYMSFYAYTFEVNVELLKFYNVQKRNNI